MKTHRYLLIILILVIAIGGCGKGNSAAGTGNGNAATAAGTITLYKQYNFESKVFADQMEVLPAYVTAYLKVQSDKPFGTKLLNVSIYTTENGNKTELFSTKGEVDPNSTVTGLPVFMIKEGDYTIEILDENRAKVLLTGKIKVGPKQ